MSAIPAEPCAHPGCGCKVDRRGDYCGDHCRRHGQNREDGTCGCGHSDCVVEEALRRVDPD